MDLILKVVEGPDDADWSGLHARFDAAGGLIGRAETARLVLPDTSRTVSRFHAHVSCSGDTFFLEEMGSRNASTINGRALKAGGKEALRPGDRVRIGQFTLAVNFEDASFPTTQVIERRSVPRVIDEDDSTRIAVRKANSVAMDSGAQLLEAFQDGARIQLEMPVGLHPEFMRTLGQVLRALIGGVHHLSTQRMRLRGGASDKGAYAQSRHIDPVRSADGETRLMTELLKPGANGLDKPPARVQAMVDDLTARIAAMRTAVDAAVEEAEARLSPGAVESRIGEAAFLDELVPMRRKARLWDLYRRTHRSFVAGSDEGRSDEKSRARSDVGNAGASGLRELFNQAFTRAYETEMSRLRKTRR